METNPFAILGHDGKADGHGMGHGGHLMGHGEHRMGHGGHGMGHRWAWRGAWWPCVTDLFVYPSSRAALVAIPTLCCN